MKTWGHDELAVDLARHLTAEGRMIWLDMQLGPAGSPRPDVYTIDKSFVRPWPTAYECKISVSDFRSDVTRAKWHAYTDFAYRVIFAAPAGLIGNADVPADCGLILRHETAWRLAKKPVVNPRRIDQGALIKLLIDGVAREGTDRWRKRWKDYDTTARFAKKFGATAARYVADATAIHHDLERAEETRMGMLDKARKEAADIRYRALKEAPVLWARLCEAVGLPPDTDTWKVQREIAAIKTAQEGTEEARELRSVLTMLRRMVDQREHFIAHKSTNTAVQISDLEV